jgi:hypothetical protein
MPGAFRALNRHEGLFNSAAIRDSATRHAHDPFCDGAEPALMRALLTAQSVRAFCMAPFATLEQSQSGGVVRLNCTPAMDDCGVKCGGHGMTFVSAEMQKGARAVKRLEITVGDTGASFALNQIDRNSPSGIDVQLAACGAVQMVFNWLKLMESPPTLAQFAQSLASPSLAATPVYLTALQNDTGALYGSGNVPGQLLVRAFVSPAHRDMCQYQVMRRHPQFKWQVTALPATLLDLLRSPSARPAAPIFGLTLDRVDPTPFAEVGLDGAVDIAWTNLQQTEV